MTDFMVSKTWKHEDLVERLQVDARMLFYDRMMYDINDSLTSILALCDVEARGSIPQIKKYISNINKSLHNTKNYHTSFTGEKRFNVSLVIKNILRILEDNYKEAQLIPFVSEIKAPGIGDQSLFEKILLCIFIDMCHKKDPDSSDIMIELRQKDQDAVFTILKDRFAFSKECLKRIDKLKEKSDFKKGIQINPHNKGVEVIIKIPLQFKTVTISKPETKKTFREKAKARIKQSKLLAWTETARGVCRQDIKQYL